MGLVARLVAVGRPGRRGTLHGRRGTWRHPPSLCVAGVALAHIALRFAWQAWHFWHWVGSGAGVALGDIHRHFPWQAWHVATSTFVLRGRRGPW